MATETDIAAMLAAHPDILHGSYVGIFILMLIEGPTVLVLAAFAARLGLCNIWIIFVLSVLGNFIPDMVCYYVGKYAGPRTKQYLDKHRERVQKIEKGYRDNLFTTLLVVKIVPFLATPGLILAGMVKIPLRQYWIFNLIVTIATSVIFTFVGYYFGETYIRLSATYGFMPTILITGTIGLILLFLIILVYPKMTTLAGKKINPNVVK